MCEIVKKCVKCELEQNIVEFYKRSTSKDGHRNTCKLCEKTYQSKYKRENKEKLKIRDNQYYIDNKEHIQKIHKEYYVDNTEKVKLYHREYRSKNENRIKKYYQENKEELDVKNREYVLRNYEKVREYKRLYQQENSVEINEYKKAWFKNRYNNDLNFKLNYICRNVLKRCLKSNKTDRTYILLGYTPNQLRQRIEMNFKPGMSWNNYGKWHIDHIKPVSAFGISTPPNIINALCNLQPLWAEENIKKSNKW